MSSTDDHDSSEDSHSSSCSSEEESKAEELTKAKQAGRARGPRGAVSSEVFGNYNKKEDFKPPTYDKPAETKQHLKERLEHAFMFGSLNPEELDIVLCAMHQVVVKPGDSIIKEGELGQDLYVVDEGNLVCTKVINGENKNLKEYGPGEVFGELALLYNAPRAATITAKVESKLWALDRRTFNFIVRDSAQKKREKYEEFLQGVPILKSMDAYERNKLADAIKESWFEEGDYIIKQGQAGNDFFLVMQGQAVATKVMEPGKPAIEVAKYSSGDYFGERALLKNEPRAANVIAKSRVCTVQLERDSFSRMLGPIDAILMRNMENYNKYM